MQKTIFSIRMASLICLVSMFGGCTANTLLDRGWGQAYYQAKAEQIMNPDAGETPVEASFDGKSAANAMDKYHNSFKKEVQRPQYTINVSGIGR